MAGRIPQNFIDDLINRVDIVEVIDARVPLKKAGREYTACCPFHNEKTPSFTISPTKQFFHCFGCGAHGTAIGFLMEYEHMEFPEAVEELARGVGMEVPHEAASHQASPAREARDTSLYELLEKSDHYYREQLRRHPKARRAVEYLKQRGLSGEVAASFGIGFAPPGWDNLSQALGSNKAIQEGLVRAGMLIRKDNGNCYDRFRDRIMFPIRDRRGRTIAFGGRILPDAAEAVDQESASAAGGRKPGAAKYLNSPETPVFHKGRELYGLYEVRKALREIPRLLVVEGYMDVVSLAQHGIYYAVATLGTATTPDHLNRLFRLTPEVVFCFDGDRAGRDAAWRALENALPIMQEGWQIRFMFLPEGEDPDTRVRAIGKASFETDMTEAMTFSDFFFQNLTRDLDLASIDGRARLVDLARPLLTRFPAGVYRHMMLTQLAQLARLELETLADSVLPDRAHTTARPASRPRQAQQKTTITPVRTAIQHLLHRPQLAQAAGKPQRFVGIELAGLPLLIELLELLQEHPHIQSAVILERWRNTPHANALAKLAIWQPPDEDEKALEEEFLGALQRIVEQQLEDRTQLLLSKADREKLSTDEKNELKQLLKK